ncbi:MAG: AAA family ATPase [Treponema sp.]|nr:AAA family ATPase [Treponema sp.]
MDELFKKKEAGESPLADRMRPKVLDEILGQDHIVGKGRLLRRAIQADRLSSIIFSGPPGTGKTSLARVIANTTSSVFESLNAVLTGIKDIREVIDRADERRRLYGRRTILFVDEVHRWNKAQQDALLPWVENGTVILIGATTENPFFEVNRALVSRSRVFLLKSLENADLMKAAEYALNDKERGYGNWKIVFEEGALEHLVEVAGGDTRSLLNALELAIETCTDKWPPPPGTELAVNMQTAEESIQKRALLYDRDGDYHFDTISAFIKSVRGSDPDAALYWLAKMIRAGEDPAFIFRRMIILAMEDVGLADPTAISTVISCAEAFDRIGLPEGRFALSLACLCLSTAAKSNSTMAFFDALREVEKEDAEVPNHLKDASRDAKSFGHGEGYIYPHSYREHWAAQQYLPAALRGRVFYNPSSVGHEALIRDDVLRRKELQAAIILSGQEREVLSYTSSAPGREGWYKRLESGRSKLLLSDRDLIFSQCNIARHSRVLIPAANDGLLLWESARRTPEGIACALVDSESSKEALLAFSSNFRQDEELEQTFISVFPSGQLPGLKQAEEFFSCDEFDYIITREPWRRAKLLSPDFFKAFADAASALLVTGGKVSILQSPPRLGERISRILKEECEGKAGIIEGLIKAEDDFFKGTGEESFRFTWGEEELKTGFENAGFKVTVKEIEQFEERLITVKDLSGWFERDKSSWGSFIVNAVGDEDFSLIHSSLEKRIKMGPVRWKWSSLLLFAEKVI